MVASFSRLSSLIAFPVGAGWRFGLSFCFCFRASSRFWSLAMVLAGALEDLEFSLFICIRAAVILLYLGSWSDLKLFATNLLRRGFCSTTLFGTVFKVIKFSLSRASLALMLLELVPELTSRGLGLIDTEGGISAVSRWTLVFFSISTSFSSRGLFSLVSSFLLAVAVIFCSLGSKAVVLLGNLAKLFVMAPVGIFLAVESLSFVRSDIDASDLLRLWVLQVSLLFGSIFSTLTLSLLF
mmetsp:Transcript_15410/g.23090  ORF Transcript_15410/g.23090 Transcript_15410/m.23090 type:complete len:239 (+) Transcript_15410:455-1171(+)